MIKTGIKWAFWRKDETESRFAGYTIVDLPPKQPITPEKPVIDKAEKDLAELKAYVGDTGENIEVGSNFSQGSTLNTPIYSLYVKNKDCFSQQSQDSDEKRRDRARAYNRQHSNRMRDGKGKKVYVTWPIDWPAYRIKYRAFKVLETYQAEYTDGLPCAYIALNAGIKLKSVKDGCTKWVKSGHVRVERNDRGVNLYLLDFRGWRLLERLREFQPTWVRARDAELARWSGRLSERWQQFDRIDLHSPHRILKEFRLE